jgi:hypothetical protein
MREFQLTHSCPLTGRTSGAYPGYVKDHIKPLACGGPDAPSNMQWQTIRDAKAKDKWETKGCATRRERAVLLNTISIAQSPQGEQRLTPIEFHGPWPNVAGPSRQDWPDGRTPQHETINRSSAFGAILSQAGCYWGRVFRRVAACG